MSEQLYYSEAQLLAFGFEEVGANTKVSKDARFFGVSGTLGSGVRIDAFAVLSGHLVLGAHVHISPFCFLSGPGGGIEMQEHSGVASHVTIYTKSEDYSAPNIGSAPKLTGAVVIGKKSILGSKTTVMPGVRIGNNVSVACNCVITQDVEADTRLINRGLRLVTLPNTSQ